MTETIRDPFAQQRRAIEDELRDRLERDRGTASGPLAAIRLMCLGCRGLTNADAHFCTKCGARFNALVVATGDPGEKDGGAA